MTVILDAPETGTARKTRDGGPKAPGGRKRASPGSFTQGTGGKVVLPEELVGAFEGHRAELTRQFAPETRYEQWLVREMALAMARLQRTADLSIADLVRCVDIAVFDWHDDRRTLAENLGKKLPADPTRVAHALEQTTHGADWKIERWEGLRAVLKTVGACDDGLRRLAQDLMGVPAEVRAGDYKVPLAGDVAGLTELAEREVARLRQRQELTLDGRDESRRSMAMAGMPFDEDPGTARLRRSESGIRRALNWAHAELLRVRDEAEPGHEAHPFDPTGLDLPPLMEPFTDEIFPPLVPPDPEPAPEEAPPVVEDETPAPSPVVAPVPAVSTFDRPLPAVPVTVKVSGVLPPAARTAAHVSAAPHRNRFQQRAAKSQARKAARQAAKAR